MGRSRFFNAACFVLVLNVATLSGCSSPQPSSDELVKANLKAIAKAYWTVHGYHNRPPRDMDELRMTVSDLHAVDMGGPPDVVLESPRDQQPFVIIIGAKPSAEETNTIMAYEKQGAGNSRYALTTTGKIIQLSNEEFATAKFANKHKPTPGE